MYLCSWKAYKSAKLKQELAFADPHRVISLLYGGLIERLSQAGGAKEHIRSAYKTNRIVRAKGILGGLQSALDSRSNSGLYDRMYALYDHMKQLPDRADAASDTAPIDEVIKLVSPLRSARDNIGAEVKARVNAGHAA